MFGDFTPCVQFSDMAVTFKEIWVYRLIFKSFPLIFFCTADAQNGYSRRARKKVSCLP